MTIITNVTAREVLDSRGNPTVECVLETTDFQVSAMVPSGASTGKFEALELRDHKKEFQGMGVKKAVKNIDTVISKKLVGRNVFEQKQLDNLMIKLDGTKNKKKLGANAILPVSLAFSRAAAFSLNKPLYKYLAVLSDNFKPRMPTPLFNLINGGKHASSDLAFQEFHLIPEKFKTFKEKLRVGSEVYHQLKLDLIKKYGKSAGNIGDEGGFVPPIVDNHAPIEMILNAARELGYEDEISLGLDVAANSFFIKGSYHLKNHRLNAGQLIDYYKDLTRTFPITLIEDPLNETDFSHWKELRKSLPKRVTIVGDDLLVTNTERIKKAINLKACDGLLLKVNQVGTLTEALEAFRLARKHDWKIIV
ncbi:MAG: enolase, partial [archaeon]